MPHLLAVSRTSSFLHLFGSRLVPQGLYLLDEPEAALSPLRQLAFLSQIKSFVAQGCQFIVATHSPILMALEGAQILHFADGEITPVAFDDVPHVTLMRGFLQNPHAFLRRL